MYEATQFISRRNAELITEESFAPTRVLISVSTPESAHLVFKDIITKPAKLDLKAWKAVLRLEFHDADPMNTEARGGRKAKFRTYFSEEQAKQVIAFIEEHAKDPEVLDLIVHCDAGISRSAAISKFAAKLYGLQWNEHYRPYNKHVFTTLLKANGQIPRDASESAFNLQGTTK